MKTKRDNYKNKIKNRIRKLLSAAFLTRKRSRIKKRKGISRDRLVAIKDAKDRKLQKQIDADIETYIQRTNALLKVGLTKEPTQKAKAIIRRMRYLKRKTQSIQKKQAAENAIKCLKDRKHKARRIYEYK